MTDIIFWGTIMRSLFFLLFFAITIFSAEGAINGEGGAMQQQEKKVISTNEHWVNIFVHGTHGSFFGLFSLSKVLKDESEGTVYRKIQDQSRKYNAFYFNRLMSLRGLHQVYVHQEKLKKIESVAAPILEAYDQIAHLVDGPEITNDYYTFGWNGVLSQTERRMEAVRFYNELSVLIQDFERAGITPKIRLLSHSHGGNLCLNLAAIHGLLNEKKSYDHHEEESLIKMKIVVNSLDTIRSPVKDDEKKWYTKPTNAALTIDELILFATPIQQETEVFCFSPFFKKIVNCYSDNDTIQKSDFISTSEKKSRNRITYDDARKHQVEIKQVRIMVDHCMTKADAGPSNEWGIKAFMNKVMHTIRIKAPFRGGRLLSDNPNDPSHADFWCVDWRKNDTFYDPLPLVVLTPLILQALQGIDAQDLDVNISATSKHARFDLYEYQSKECLKQSLCSLREINKVRHMFLNTKNLKKVFNFSFTFGWDE